jgi:hypothetical protein
MTLLKSTLMPEGKRLYLSWQGSSIKGSYTVRKIVDVGNVSLLKFFALAELKN